MKNRKWLTYILGALLTLIVLAAVGGGGGGGGAGFRVGMMQNVSNMTGRPTFTHNFDGDFSRRCRETVRMMEVPRADR